MLSATGTSKCIINGSSGGRRKKVLLLSLKLWLSLSISFFSSLSSYFIINITNNKSNINRSKCADINTVSNGAAVATNVATISATL